MEAVPTKAGKDDFHIVPFIFFSQLLEGNERSIDQGDQTWILQTVLSGIVTFTSTNGGVPLAKLIVPWNRADGPFSGITATVIGTLGVKLRAWTRTIWLVGDSAGHEMETGAGASWTMLVPATLRISNLG